MKFNQQFYQKSNKLSQNGSQTQSIQESRSISQLKLNLRKLNIFMKKFMIKKRIQNGQFSISMQLY